MTEDDPMATKKEIRAKRQEFVDLCNGKYKNRTESPEYCTLKEKIDLLTWVLYSNSKHEKIYIDPFEQRNIK